MSAPLLKVCGFTQPQDIDQAVELGVWAAGFVLAESPRRLSPANAAELVALLRSRRSGPTPLAVGVFVDEDAGRVAELADHLGLEGVQLHGSEPPEHVAALRRALPRLTLIKALGVAPPSTTGYAAAGRALCRLAQGYVGHVDFLLLDTRFQGRMGGTGATFDPRVARIITPLVPVLVAGGVNPTNVTQILASSGAAGVDVCSGVEARPGRKDPRAFQALADLVGRASAPGRASSGRTGAPAAPTAAPATDDQLITNRGASR